MIRIFKLSFLAVALISFQAAYAQVYDGAVVEQISPDSCASSSQISVVVENKGSATITYLTVRWTVNGSSQGRAAFSGLNLAQNAKDTLNLGTFSFGGGATDVVVAWTDTVNGLRDDNRSNDTLTTNVHTPPTATFSSIPDICENDGSLTLSQGSGTPSGGTGTYFGPGVNGGIFEPSQAAAGMHTLSYVYTGTNGCTDTATQTVQVDTVPLVNFTAGNPVCENGGMFPLVTGTPMGGNYTGTGVNNNIFNPANAGPGNHNITYTFTDSKGCVDSSSAQQQVDSVTLASFTLPVNICLNGDSMALTTGTPVGGVYSGNQVNGNFYTPVSLGFDTIFYSYTNQLACTDTDTGIIRVDATPKVAFNAIPNVCENSGLFTFTQASPNGGTYSGPNVVGGQYDPVSAGTDTIKYVYIDNRGCSDSATQVITVDSLPIVRLIPFPSNCDNNPAFMLNGGLPFGGTYSGAGVNGNQYHPSQAGAGTDTVTYVFTDGNNCTDSAKQALVVNAAPTVTLTAPNPVCDNSGDLTLSGGTPNGGEYHGMYVNRTTGVFSPDDAGAGKHVFGYTFTDANTCRDSIFDTLEVVASPVFTLGNDTSICGEDKVTLDPGLSGLVYLWSTGETTQSIEVQKSDLFWVKVTDNSNPANCASEDTIRVDYDALCLGINSLTAEEVSVRFFPNPSNGVFQFEVNGGTGQELEMRVFSLNGSEVFSQNWAAQSDLFQGEIRLEVEPGIYLIQVVSGDQAAVKRIQVQ